MLLPLTAEGIDGMRDNDVRRALQRGDSAIGLMVFEFGTPGVGRMARAAGAEDITAGVRTHRHCLSSDSPSRDARKE